MCLGTLAAPILAARRDDARHVSIGSMWLIAKVPAKELAEITRNIDRLKHAF
jgi:hypothetical protein